MADIKARYDEIFALCARTPGGFIHEPDRRPFFEVPREERLAKWEQLYGEPGFGIWLANFRDIFMDEEANAELSEFIADKIRSRVHDPVVAEKLIPKDHGFGVQRVPMETGYYEAYNRDNVHLVDLQRDADRADHARRASRPATAASTSSTSSSTPPASTPSPAPTTASTSAASAASR